MKQGLDHLHSEEVIAQGHAAGEGWSRPSSCWGSGSTARLLSGCIIPPDNVTRLGWAWCTETKCQHPGQLGSKGRCLGETKEVLF